jgi:hypothetical protein
MNEDTTANSEQHDSDERLGRRSFLKVGAVVSAVATSGFGMSGVLSRDDTGSRSGTDTDARFGYGGTPVTTTVAAKSPGVGGTTAADGTTHTQADSTATAETVGDTAIPSVSTTAVPTGAGVRSETTTPTATTTGEATSTVTDGEESGSGNVGGVDGSEQAPIGTAPSTPAPTTAVSSPQTSNEPETPVETATDTSASTETSTAAPGESGTPTETPTPAPEPTAAQKLADEYGEQGYGEYGYGGVPP